MLQFESFLIQLPELQSLHPLRTREVRMSTRWPDSLIDRICDCLVCEIKGRMSPLTFKVRSPDENSLGTWLIAIAPASGQLIGGKDDGSEIFDPIDADLLKLSNLLDETETFSFDSGSASEGPHLCLDGLSDGKKTTVQIFFAPFDESDPSWSLDVNQGTWKIPDQDEPAE